MGSICAENGFQSCKTTRRRYGEIDPYPGAWPVAPRHVAGTESTYSSGTLRVLCVSMVLQVSQLGQGASDVARAGFAQGRGGLQGLPRCPGVVRCDAGGGARRDPGPGGRERRGQIHPHPHPGRRVSARHGPALPGRPGGRLPQHPRGRAGRRQRGFPGAQPGAQPDRGGERLCQPTAPRRPRTDQPAEDAAGHARAARHVSGRLSGPAPRSAASRWATSRWSRS